MLTGMSNVMHLKLISQYSTSPPSLLLSFSILAESNLFFRSLRSKTLESSLTPLLLLHVTSNLPTTYKASYDLVPGFFLTSSLPTLPLPFSMLATMISSVFLQLSRHTPISGPLHLLFQLPHRTSFRSSLKCHLKKQGLSRSYLKLQLLSLPTMYTHFNPLPCFIFLIMYH